LTILPQTLVKRQALRRYFGDKDLHFITFSCYHRKPYLSTPKACDIFVRTMDEVRNRHCFRLIAYVVMPEHVHLLMGEPETKTLSVALQSLKQKVAKQMLGMAHICSGDERRHFWQRRFYDFNVWTESKLREKLDYIHGNPVRRGLVSHPADWPWSSWAFYEERRLGRIRIDLI
jgi:putative transposase